MIKILVTGSNGQLGKELKKISPSFPQFEFIFFIKRRSAHSSFEMIRHYFKIYQPQYLINCAAYTAVDRAESEKDLAFQVKWGSSRSVSSHL
jgi:dTDP-4-dehydrorhamnose reductase